MQRVRIVGDYGPTHAADTESRRQRSTTTSRKPSPEDAHKGIPEPAPYAAGCSPPYGFNPPPYHPGPVPVPTAVTLIQPSARLPLGPDPANIICPSCRATVSTKVEQETTTKTHLICLIMCVFGLWPCCLFPYCMDSCKNTNHYCPACGAFLGEYKR